MASTFQFNQGCGSSLGTVFDIGAGSGDNEFNFMSADATAALTPVYSSNQIAAGNNSFSIGVRGHWTGSFNSIGSIYVWGTNVTNITNNAGTGSAVNASTQASVWTPSASSTGDSAIPTTQGAGLTPTYSSNYCQWTRLQLATINTAPVPGDTGSMTLNIQWTES
jgi:hypothetical protein